MRGDQNNPLQIGALEKLNVGEVMTGANLNTPMENPPKEWWTVRIKGKIFNDNPLDAKLIGYDSVVVEPAHFKGRAVRFYISDLSQPS